MPPQGPEHLVRVGCPAHNCGGRCLLIAHVEDGVITFPLDAKGKLAVAEGVVQVNMLTKEQAIAQAKEMHKERGTMAKFDPSKYTGPVMDVQIMGEGAKVK